MPKAIAPRVRPADSRAAELARAHAAASAARAAAHCGLAAGARSAVVEVGGPWAAGLGYRAVVDSSADSDVVPGAAAGRAGRLLGCAAPGRASPCRPVGRDGAGAAPAAAARRR